jgi:hypothetical protein
MVTKGTVIASKGMIGGWNIATSENKGLYYGCNSINSTADGTYVGPDGIRTYKNGIGLTIANG